MNSVQFQNMEEIAEVKADAKNRISLGSRVKLSADRYRVWHDRQSGRIVLEPLAVLPISERWLERAPEAKASVERGLAQARAGRLAKAPEDFSRYAGRK